ncbi:helix-turn-helix domain-containing protein [Streptomyces albidoflavus]
MQIRRLVQFRLWPSPRSRPPSAEDDRVRNSATDHPQSPRNAWINALRNEALRVGRTEVSRCVHIGLLIATYADGDGGNAFPSARTLATVAGCSEETVGRCVKVLMAVGVLRRRRRPNRASVYQLVVPVARPDWESHLHLYTDTRQARRRAAAKERACAAEFGARPPAAGSPSPDGVRTPFPPVGPDTVPAGDSAPPGTRSGTPPAPVAERVSDTVPAGGDHYPPTCGGYPHPDHTPAPRSPQPPVGAATSAPLARCETCPTPLLRPGRTRCHGCEHRPAATGAVYRTPPGSARVPRHQPHPARPSLT